MSIFTIILDGYVYLGLLLWLVAAIWLESSKRFSRYRKLYSLITAITFILIIGLRWETGTDWEAYKELFDNIVLKWDYILEVFHFETGYVLLNAVIKCFSNNYTIFLLVDSFITIGLLYLLIQKITYYPSVAWLLFFVNFMLIQFMGSNRRMIAMALILWMIYFIATNQKIKAIISIGLAATFHKSAIGNAIVYLFPKKIISTIKIITIASVCGLLGILQIPLKLIEISIGTLGQIVQLPLLDLFIIYSNAESDHLVLSTGSLVLNTVLAIIKRGVFLSFYIHILSKHPADKITVAFYNAYVISICLYLLLIGTFFQIQTAYLALAEIILIGRIYKYTNRKEKIVFCSLIIIFGLIQLKNALGIYPELYLPYKCIL